MIYRYIYIYIYIYRLIIIIIMIIYIYICIGFVIQAGNIYIYIYTHIYRLSGSRAQGRTSARPFSRSKLLHTRNHKGEIHSKTPLNIHWTTPVKINWKSDNPVEHMIICWNMPLTSHRKMPLENHGDF